MILQEIISINEKKWKNLHKIIEHNAPDKVFPMVKKMLKPNNNIKISTQLIDNDNKKLINKVKDSIKIVMNKDKQLCVTSEIEKVNVLAAYYELVNSPNNLNNNTRLREIIEKKMNNFNIETKKYMEVNKSIVKFSDNTLSSSYRHKILTEYQYENPFCDLNSLSKVIMNLPNKTSSGTDNIPATVIKNLPKAMIRELVILFNNAINNNYFSKVWKTAVIVPILKSKKTPSNPTSHRPISLTKSLSKVYETLINNALLSHITKNKLISDNQYGFKRNHSTIHVINKLVSDVNNHLLKNQTVGAVLLDLEKAFDTVWLDGLIFTLITLKFSPELKTLVNDTIRDKKFYVKGNNTCSETRSILDGLQQGTINSPILFSLYTNKVLELHDINTENNTYAIAHADDLIIYVADNQIGKIKSKLNDLVNKTNRMYTDWDLKVNPEKCETIVFRNPRVILGTLKAREIKNLQITTTVPGTGREVNIPNKEIVKYLGVTVDYLMNFKHHIEAMLTRAKTAYYSLNRIVFNRVSSGRTKILCYMIFVRSLLTYACPI